MSWESVFKQLRDLGYVVTKVSWDDTGRSFQSSYGPNISDQTLVVDGELMPVVRRNNFSDETCDLPIEVFTLRTGNDTGSELKTVPLADVLKEKGWLLPRDSHIQVSTQLCLLPLGFDGHKEFGLRLFNYQSTSTESALAVVVVSSQGTSIAPILADRERQVVYFNQNGTARPFEARRLKADRLERKVADTGLDLSKEEKDRNQLLVFHVPLRVARPARSQTVYKSFGAIATCAVGVADGGDDMGGGWDCVLESSMGGGWTCPPMGSNPAALCSMNSAGFAGPASFFGGLNRGKSLPAAGCAVPVAQGPKFDAAMLRVSGRDAGKFFGLDPSKSYERDPTLPIRCVVQTYAAIGPSDQTLSPEAMQYIIAQLENPYKKAVAKGSHVTGTGTQDRVTAPTIAPPLAPAPAGLASMMEF